MKKDKVFIFLPSWHEGRLLLFDPIINSYLLFLSRTEPIGSSLPKFLTDDKYDAFSRDMGATVALKCPAQAYPLPSFRLEFDNNLVHQNCN